MNHTRHLVFLGRGPNDVGGRLVDGVYFAPLGSDVALHWMPDEAWVAQDRPLDVVVEHQLVAA